MSAPERWVVVTLRPRPNASQRIIVRVQSVEARVPVDVDKRFPLAA